MRYMRLMVCALIVIISIGVVPVTGTAQAATPESEQEEQNGQPADSGTTQKVEDFLDEVFDAYNARDEQVVYAFAEPALDLFWADTYEDAESFVQDFGVRAKLSLVEDVLVFPDDSISVTLSYKGWSFSTEYITDIWRLEPQATSEEFPYLVVATYSAPVELPSRARPQEFDLIVTDRGLEAKEPIRPNSEATVFVFNVENQTDSIMTVSLFLTGETQDIRSAQDVLSDSSDGVGGFDWLGDMSVSPRDTHQYAYDATEDPSLLQLYQWQDDGSVELLEGYDNAILFNRQLPGDKKAP